MTLRELVAILPRASAVGSLDREILGLQDDSRKVRAGDLFIAVKGMTSDGHDYVDAAIERGAVGVVVERAVRENMPDGVSSILVPDSRQALGALSSEWNGNPSGDLRVVGVTGTNGKTTTAFLVHRIMKQTMQRAGLVGTVVSDDGMTQEQADFTTPGPISLQSLLARIRNNGCPGVALEVSSQGLDQRRADAITFDVAVFTNLTRDHLDYHGSMEKYFASKRRLFENAAESSAGKNPVAVINGDDPYGEALIREFSERMNVLSYGFSVESDFRAGNVQQTAQETRFQLFAKGKSYLVRLPLIGRFNVYNALGALASSVALKIPLREGIAALANAPQVPGRVECVGSMDGATVFVDYAHTPDALQNVCRSLRGLDPRRLITVFGCGGDRDREKRPLMGAVASRHSDYCVVTSDNPRSEDPERIIADIEEGMSGAVYERIVDRGEAIRAAIQEARGGDIVLVAGKGHESYQEVAGDRSLFDDRKETRNAMDARRKARGEDRV
ncbi:MAG TPA: UDP-N-acetylmuramoyl-L-alanyl-D-glutamate--2,6-diaminopimelate ligase [Verrucomicrobiales bacterium]|nr:UDP-N-acetylmuramoyl-L-alanyl-D-glutamate--2,6-diaminopimelate ligase [Verrucomicrobiales bacterium]